MRGFQEKIINRTAEKSLLSKKSREGFESISARLCAANDKTAVLALRYGY